MLVDNLCSAAVGIVTVTYNSSAVIDGFLSSLYRQTYADFYLYVVDNASEDDTIRRLGQYADARCHVIANTVNVGFAQANNQGTRAALDAGCKLVLFINNDTEFDSEVLGNLVKTLNRSQGHMVAPKIVFHDNPKILWSAGGGFDPFKGYSGFHYGVRELDCGQYDEERFVEHAPACCLLIRREVFERIGLMDELYFAYHDDTDFSYRAKRAGLKILYCPEITVLHKASSLTGGEDSLFSIRYRTRNQIYFMLKHLGVLRSLLYIPAFQLRLFSKLLLGEINSSGLYLREKSFWEGLLLWKRSRAGDLHRKYAGGL